MDWGDTFGIGLGVRNDKYLLVWTPKKSSEGQILPGFDSEDGALTLKMKPRPGAWITWIDEAKVIAEAKDDADRVRKSVQELDRNARQITDFADGVLKDITALHLGKPLTLSELAQEVLQAEFAIPTAVKTGGYVLANSQETTSLVRVIIPEQTNIHRVHMNEDELFESVATGAYDQLLVVYRTHIKRYPDLLDVNYCLTLKDYFHGEPTPEGIVSSIPCAHPKEAGEIEIFPTAASYDPLQPDHLHFVVTAFQASREQVLEAITHCSSLMEQYVERANQRAYEIMANFQGRTNSRLKALSLQPSQRVYEKVWDDIAINELRNQMLEFTEFFGEYLSENFGADAAGTRKDLLKHSIDPMIEAWQIHDLRQTTLKHLIFSGYKLANQVLDRATGIFYDLIFEKHFIEAKLLRTIELLVLEDGELLDQVRTPEWTKKTVRDGLHRFALNPSVHPKQIERLRNLWMELLEIGNAASQHGQQFETLLKPLSDLLLMTKQSSTDKSPTVSLRKDNAFEGFEISDEEFAQICVCLKNDFPLIKRWIRHAPKEQSKQEPYYATLWMILMDGKVREMLLQNFQPICDINLSQPVETKRLLDLVLGGQIIIRDEKDLKSLARNLERALSAKMGRGLVELTTPSLLKIHSDTLLCLLREEILAYQEGLEKQISRITNPKLQKKKGKRKKSGESDISSESVVEEMLEAIEAEKPKIAEIIEFLTPYTDAPSTLIETAINPRSQQLNQIRRHQVLNFDLQALPPIEKTWLENVKSVRDYPNLRAFLFENKLPISTTGRLLMDVRRAFPDSAVQDPSSADVFDVALDLVQELKALQDAGYAGEALKKFMNYIAEKLWRWELTQITEAELPMLIKEKVLASAICYGKEVEALLEYVERYEQLLETKLTSGSEMDKQRSLVEAKYQAIAETIL